MASVENSYTMRFDAKSLLLSNRATEIVYDPFCLFEVNDYLPADLYRLSSRLFRKNAGLWNKPRATNAGSTLHTVQRFLKIFVASIRSGTNSSNFWAQRLSFAT